MDTISNIRDLINLWPSRAALLADLQSACPTLPMSIHRINKWAETNSIRAQYHFAVLRAAQLRGLNVTADLIVALHAPDADRGGAAPSERHVA